MLKKVIPLFAFWLLCFLPNIFAEEIPILSDSSAISILTCSPGDELYSAFGHTAVRVKDDSTGMDVVFNYGVFSFSQPGFYKNFVQGRMRYMLGVDAYEDFYASYVMENRSIIEQKLNLTNDEKRKIFAYLAWNSLKENREYLYDFFWDNCATRPIAVFDTILGSKIKYDLTTGFQKDKTMHDMLRLYVHDRPWVDFGFDLILGLPCEIEAKPRYQTFLPDYEKILFDNATVNGQPFVTESEEVLARGPSQRKPATILPVHVTGLLLLIALALTFVEYKKNIRFWWFDFIVFFIMGFFGIFFLCLWAFTDHYSLPKNLNVLWAIPTHLIVAFFMLPKNKPKWLSRYALFTGVAMIGLLLMWKFSPQPFNYALLPIVFMMGVRGFSMFNYLSKQK
jgi:hypothetical protein